MILQKAVVSSKGWTATLAVLRYSGFDINKHLESDGVTRLHNCDCNLQLYINQDCLDSDEPVDNCKIIFNDLTEAEIIGNTPNFIRDRIMTSVLDSDGNETNLFKSSHCGMVGFQGATIIS